MKTRKLFLSVLAVAGMLYATSCSKEELQNVPIEEDYISATFTLGASDALGTRAEAEIGKGLKADVVACAVYDSKGDEMTELRNNEVQVFEKDGKRVAEYSVRLAKGQAYRVAFFAYNKAAAAYNVTDLKNITVNDNQDSNNENRDAFTNYVDITAAQTMKAISQPVVLKRPFAQLNLGIDNTELTDAANAGVKVTKSQIKVSNVYSTFSAFDNEVVGNTKEMTFNMKEIPNETLYADVDNDGVNESYTYLALNYLLVGDMNAEKSLSDVEFVWETKDGKTNNPTTKFINIPVQRNYRTNIIGKLLTNPATFNITIDASFTDENNVANPDYNVVYAGGTSSNPDKLENTLKNIKATDAVVKVPAGSYISWTTGSGLGSTPLVDNTNNVTETLTIQGEGEGSVLIVDGKGVGSLRAANGAKLIFKDITIEDRSLSYNENAWEFTYLEFAGNLEFNNVTFKGGIQLQTEDNETALNATFNNCTFITNEESVYGVWVLDGITTFSNCKFQGTRGLKMHEDYGSEITSVTVDACEFGPLTKKPGIAIGDLNPATTVTIKNSSFIGCQAGDQGNYIYETDTDISTFTFVNSNNSVEEDPANILKIGTKAEFIAFQKAVNEDGNNFSGKTIKLTANIDLENMDWEPIGQTGGNGAATHFVGTFDGQNHIISNFKITTDGIYDNGKNYAAGLFGFVDAGDAVIKNLKVDNAVVEGHHWTAVICGYLTGSIQNCHVTNSNVTCSHYDDDACGDKAGMIVGYTNHSTTTVKDCTAKNGTVKAGRDAGQIVGCNSNGVVVSGCSAENIIVSALSGCTGANIKNDIIGRQN